MSAHDDQTIDRAVRAMGRALATGADHKSAMRAALNSAASTGCLREYTVTVRGVRLAVGFEADIEDGWVITTAAGTDISQLADDGGDEAAMRLFRGVGRMFVRTPKAAIVRDLEAQAEKSERKLQVCRATLVHLTEQVKHADAAFLETAAQIRRKFERA